MERSLFIFWRLGWFIRYYFYNLFNKGVESVFIFMLRWGRSVICFYFINLSLIFILSITILFYIIWIITDIIYYRYIFIIKAKSLFIWNVLYSNRKTILVMYFIYHCFYDYICSLIQLNDSYSTYKFYLIFNLLFYIIYFFIHKLSISLINIYWKHDIYKFQQLWNLHFLLLNSLWKIQ
jgi:hypothetical protein